MTSLIKKLSIALVAGAITAVSIGAPANATGSSASWNGNAPTFAAGSTPAMDINFSRGNPSAEARQVGISIKDAQGQSMSLTTLSSGSLAGCQLTALSGIDLQIHSNTCTRVNGMPSNGIPGSYNSISVRNTGQSFAGATGDFNIAVPAGMATGLMAGQTYDVWVGLFDISNSLVDSATISVTIPGGNNNQNNNFQACTSGSMQSQYMLQIMGGNLAVTSGGAHDCLYRFAQAATVAPANPFTRTGFTFTGWKTTQNVPVAVGDPVNASIGMPFQLYAVWTPNSSSNNSQRPSASLGLTLSRGSRVAQAPAPVTASGLLPNAAYTVEVHSTPIIIASGNVANDGTVNYTAAIPSGLDAGWHTMIFTSTAADGTSFTSTYYFKVAGDGTLLSTSDTLPAELANTGINTATGISLLVGGASLALVGAELMLIARRKRSN